MESPQQFREAVARLEATHVRFVLWDPRVDQLLHIMLPRYETATVSEHVIERYLGSHYHQIGFANRFRVMERNP
jgi:hypothetical protein